MRPPFTAGRARQSGGDDRAGGDAPVLLAAPQTSFEVYNSPPRYTGTAYESYVILI